MSAASRRAPSFVAVVLLAAAVSGCAGSRHLSEPAPLSSHLAAWLAWDERRTPLYRIAVALPGPELEALAREGETLVRLVLSARVTSPAGQVLGGDAWTRQIARADLRAHGELHWCVELGTLPGAQDLALNLLVQGQAWGTPWRRRFDVPSLLPTDLYLAEPVFLRGPRAAASPAASPADSACDAILVGGYYDAENGPPRLRAVVYDFAAPAADTLFQVAYVVRGLDAPAATAGASDAVAQGALTLARQGWMTALEWELPAVPLGRQAVELRLQGAGRSANATARFEVGLTDLAALAGSDGGMDLLRLLLSPAEADSLRRAAPAAREALWQELWRRRDPEPSTPVNEALEAALARVREANLRFGGASPGWRTDRGRVLIAFGAPDVVDTLQNPEGFDRIERWTYTASNTVFVFVDRDGRGDYVLLRSNAPGF